MENLNLDANNASETNKVINAEIKKANLQKKKDAKKSATNVENVYHKTLKADNKVLTATSKKGEKLISLNLSKFKNTLDKFSGKEIVTKDNMYIYPAGFSEMDKNGKKGRQFRQNKRNRFEQFCNNIQMFAKYARHADLIAEANKFEAFYKEFYLITDFSVNSVTRTQNVAKNDFIKDSLDLIKEVLLQTGKKGKK